jgi:Cu-processing system permease protein
MLRVPVTARNVLVGPQSFLAGPQNILIVLQKELRDALRNRWLWLFAAAFGALGLALGALGLAQTGGALGFSRTAAGLINLTLLLVPLFGLTLGAQAIAGERERRTLPYLLAQPLGRLELLLGKYLGLALALSAALALGLGAAGLVLAPDATDLGDYAALAGLALLLGLASLSMGLLISTLARRTSVALGVALFVWFGLVFLGDLGLMGASVALQLGAQAILCLALANPLQVYKLAAVLTIRPDLDLLGPAGLYGAETFGAWLGPALVGLLTAWVALPLAAAGALLARREEP